jgi:hypothetical protein
VARAIKTTGTSAAAFRPPKVNTVKITPETAPPKAPDRFMSESLKP